MRWSRTGAVGVTMKWRGAHRPPVGERRRQPARRDLLLAQIGNPHEAAGGIRLELQQGADLVGCQVSGDSRILWLCGGLRVGSDRRRQRRSASSCCGAILRKLRRAGEWSRFDMVAPADASKTRGIEWNSVGGFRAADAGRQADAKVERRL